MGFEAAVYSGPNESTDVFGETLKAEKRIPFTWRI